MITAAAALLVGAIIGWRLCAWDRDSGLADLLAGLYLRGYLKQETFDIAQDQRQMRALIEEGHRHGR